MNTNLSGAIGEYHAVRYYRDKGYTVLSTNFRTRHGEIDIILQKGNQIIFCEVKLRKQNAKIKGSEAVDFHKQQKVIKTASQYLSNINDSHSFIRFDVVEVVPKQGIYQVNCIENAFQAETI